MLSRAFEWYRTVNVKATSATIDKRVSAASDLIAAMDNADTFELLLESAVGVVAGFDKVGREDSLAVNAVVASIRAHESAFPKALSENALELRVCAAIALGEVLARPKNGTASVDAFVAAAIRSGLGVRPPAPGKYLRQMLDELHELAAETLEAAASRHRGAPVDYAQQLEELPEPADLPAAWESLVKAVSEAARRATIDREELNILWWMFSGTSTGTTTAIASLPMGRAILCSGAELGSQCLVPPAASVEAMVQRALETGRSEQELKKRRSIVAVAAEWGEDLLSSLVPDEGARELARDYPALFPLVWLGDRLLSSKSAGDWAEEFKLVTQMPATYERVGSEWAIQVFRERTAQRLYSVVTD